MSVEQLAKVMYLQHVGDGVHSAWEYVGGYTQSHWKRTAKAALRYLGFPEGAEPEAGCVQEAEEAGNALSQMLDECRARASSQLFEDARIALLGWRNAIRTLTGGGGGEESPDA